jgi:hypothetical protein
MQEVYKEFCPRESMEEELTEEQKSENAGSLKQFVQDIMDGKIPIDEDEDEDDSLDYQVIQDIMNGKIPIDDDEDNSPDYQVIESDDDDEESD